MCIDKGVRIPDGILLLYCPTLINFVVSPARMLCLMDPLLPFSFMMGCLRAYTCPNEELEKKQKRVAQLLNTPRVKSKTHYPFTSSTAGSAIDPKNRRATLDPVYKGSMVELGQECTEAELAGIVPTERSQSIDVTASEDRSEVSDTMASASMNSNCSNTEAPTPDESNGISFEEDSQPIYNFYPPSANGLFSATNGNGGGGAGNGTVKDVGQLYPSLDDDMNLDDELPNDPTVQYVSDFLDR